MRLTQLEPRFLKCVDSRTYHQVDAIGEADGIVFLCPKCWENRPKGEGVHSVICWQPHVPEEMRPGPGRWKLSGTCYDDLTLSASSSSVALTGGCSAHFFISQGDVLMV